MIDIINVSVDSNHLFKCTPHVIALQGEGLSHCFVIEVGDALTKYWPYLDFQKPNGEKFKTPRLVFDNNKIIYKLPLFLLDEKGTLEVQLVLQDENGFVWKSNVKKFSIRSSINAVDDIPNKVDFIAEAQALLDTLTETADVAKENATEAQALLDTLNAMVGDVSSDISSALDHIIELQESLTGGGV